MGFTNEEDHPEVAPSQFEINYGYGRWSPRQTRFSGSTATVDNLRQAERYLPDNIYDAIAGFTSAEWTSTILGEDVKSRFAELKRASAERCARQQTRLLEARRCSTTARPTTSFAR
jgi:glutamine synthetase